MPVDTLLAYTGIYGSVDDALADYDTIHELHMSAGLINTSDRGRGGTSGGRQSQDRQEA